MAAIDIDMSQFTVKNTLAGTDYISGTLADGSAVKIKVSDIASVVAGMMQPVRNIGSMSALGGTANKYMTPCILGLAYETSDSTTLGLPSGLTSIYGTLIVFRGGPDLITQICALTVGTWIRTGIESQSPIFRNGWVKIG